MIQIKRNFFQFLTDKSYRMRQMLELTGQSLMTQGFVVKEVVEAWIMYVLFSDADSPHPRELECLWRMFYSSKYCLSFNTYNVQQTPNPDAQVPSEVPPLVLHSDLKCRNCNQFWRPCKNSKILTKYILLCVAGSVVSCSSTCIIGKPYNLNMKLIEFCWFWTFKKD